MVSYKLLLLKDLTRLKNHIDEKIIELSCMPDEQVKEENEKLRLNLANACKVVIGKWFN